MADPVVDEEYLSQIEKARRVLRGLVATWNCAPIFQRLAWFDALDYDINTNTGGVNGSIRNSQRVQTDWCMKQGIQMFESLKMEYPRITYADLIQLGGVVAVEVTGGPTIDFVPGRKDLPSTEAQPSLFRPDEDMESKFNKMGLSHRDLVVSFGRWEESRGHRETLEHGGGVWFITQPLKFDNSFFRELLEDEKHGRSSTRTDEFLLHDALRHYIEQYAMDEDAFFRDYAVFHKKFSELGFTPSTSTSTSSSSEEEEEEEEEEGHSHIEAASKSCINYILARSIVAIAIGYLGVVSILTYFFELKKVY